MEQKKITEAMRQQLRAPLPAEAVTKHPTKTYLSSIKAIYVFERLNDVFGIGSYKITSKEISCEKGAPVVKVRLQIPEYGIDLSSYGGNDNGGEGSKNYDLGDAYKGAATDAITKICSWLEIGISVFKGQGNKPEPNKAPQQAQPAQAVQPKPQPQKAQENAPNVLQAVKELLASKSREESNQIWKQYPQFHKEKSFIEAGKAVALLYPKPEAGKEVSHAG